MKNQLRGLGKYAVSGVTGFTIGVALMWTGGELLEDVGDVVDQLVSRVGTLEDTVDELETDLGDTEEVLDEANDQLRQANEDAQALHDRVREAIAGIDGVELAIN